MNTLGKHVCVRTRSESEATSSFLRTSSILLLEVVSHRFRYFSQTCCAERLNPASLGSFLQTLKGGIDFCLLFLGLDMFVDFASPTSVNVPATEQLLVWSGEVTNPCVVIGICVIAPENYRSYVATSLPDASKKNSEGVCRFFVANEPRYWDALVMVIKNWHCC